MTLNGAITELVVLHEHPMMPCVFKPGIQHVIETLAEVEEPKRWIPVFEKLPEQTGKYLVTVKNGNVYATAYCAMDKKFNCAAVAWMDLPEPYKEGHDEKKQ